MDFRGDQTKKYFKIYNRYKVDVGKRLKTFTEVKYPVTVYAPIRYILSSGGKRIRAVLTILACEVVGGKAANAFNAATAIEILHNFTLVHDDVMDHAEMRRRKPTVHKKWDENVAILSGDEMIAQAYRILLKTRSSRLKNILDVYTDALVQVCEGQGFDKEFEKQSAVTLDDYFMMISKKTGRVIAASTEIGAIIGEGTPKQITALRKYGEHLGRAFQVMDDLLDIVGDTKEFGKEIGGDIKEGKKTYLLIKAIENTGEKNRQLLKSISSGNNISASQVRKIKRIYISSGAVSAAKEEIARSTLEAQRAIASLPSSSAKSMLLWLSNQLRERTS
ncbi:MAG: polyprenyl synthetase family protein [Ignavibacteriales bacterium]|nr:polyprenyl synthetase family protein [Ignavibacteriales bacterium]